MRTRLILLMAVGAAMASAQSDGTRWQTPARWHRTLRKTVPGPVLIDVSGVEFQSARFRKRWAPVDIRSFDLSAKDQPWESYGGRPGQEPGERNFRFTGSEPIPPQIATQRTERVGKPG